MKGVFGIMPTSRTSLFPSLCGPPRGRRSPTSVRLSASGLRSDSTSGGKQKLGYFGPLKLSLQGTLTSQKLLSGQSFSSKVSSRVKLRVGSGSRVVCSEIESPHCGFELWSSVAAATLLSLLSRCRSRYEARPPSELRRTKLLL